MRFIRSFSLALAAGLVMATTPAWAQNLPSIVYQPWSDLADGVRYREASSTSPRWAIQIVEVDLSSPRVTLTPVRSLVGGGYERTSVMAARIDGIAAINGGYFGGGQSYSHFELYDNRTSVNVGSRPPRTTFGIGPGNAPMLMHPISSQSAPSPALPDWQNVQHAIGGGPRLVTGGTVTLRDVEEGFDAASGVGPTVRNPRTALGWNSTTKRLYMVTVDGRQSTWSVGMTFAELASLMLDIGCTDAMNYDGGGSTTMWAGTVRNRPSDGSERAVSNAWVVTPGYRIDNMDPRFSFTGGWFASANAGFYLENSMVVASGNGSSTATWRPGLAEAGEYEVRAWWVAANNRNTAAPFTIHHRDGASLVAMDQTANGARWNVLGRFQFEAGEGARVVLTNAGASNTFTSADAVEFLYIGPLSQVSLGDGWLGY